MLILAILLNNENFNLIGNQQHKIQDMHRDAKEVVNIGSIASLRDHRAEDLGKLTSWKLQNWKFNFGHSHYV